MAARKLQTEIDRTLKKVAEGVELFESIYDKMQASTNQTQKEKLEADLKSQIKKLQRLRDQIKTWVASNDIKDKSVLLENRKLIETQMEKFKACEKELKTKAFSTIGLIAPAKLDPKEQEKQDTVQWLQGEVEKLLLQVEQSEAEIESLQGTTKKKGKGGSSTAGRLEELERLNDLRKWHISRLELVLRLLENGSLTTERVLTLKDDVSFFVESNADDDFEADEGIYDELNLDEEEAKFGVAGEEQEESDVSDEISEDLPPRTPSKKHDKHDEESVASSKRDSPVLKKAPVTLQLRKSSTAAENAPKPPNPNFQQQPMASILKAGLPQPTKPAALPIRYAAAAAAAVSTPKENAAPPTPSAASAAHPPPVTPTAPSIAPSASATSNSQDRSPGPSSPSLTHASASSPMLSSASVSHQQDGSFYSGQDSPAISEAVAHSVDGPVATSSPQRSLKDAVSSPPQPTPLSPSAAQALASEPQQQQLQPQPQVNGTMPPPSQPPAQTAPSPLPQQVQQYPQAVPQNESSTSSSPMAAQAQQQPQQHPQFPPGVKVPPSEQAAAALQVPQQSVGTQRPPSTSSQVPPQPQRAASNAFPSLQDLVMSFENVKQKAPHRMASLDQVQKMLEGGYRSVPQPQDTEKPKYYIPRNPYQTPAYYPQVPHPLLSSAAIFSQLDVETLFYVFYFLPGTYQQFLAAKELKRQSWRFHVKYLTWFQRHSEPQAITEEYEQGVYVYFDWEGSWCQRKKSDFRFEYRYLSED